MTIHVCKNEKKKASLSAKCIKRSRVEVERNLMVLSGGRCGPFRQCESTVVAAVPSQRDNVHVYTVASQVDKPVFWTTLRHSCRTADATATVHVYGRSRMPLSRIPGRYNAERTQRGADTGHLPTGELIVLHAFIKFGHAGTADTVK